LETRSVFSRRPVCQSRDQRPDDIADASSISRGCDRPASEGRRDLAGTNDISGNTGPITLEGIENNYESMVDLAHANGINVVFASVMPISDYNKNAQGNPIVRSVQRPPAQIAALNEWIKKYCAERKLVYLDYFSAMADEKGFLKADIANDGLHPNAKGYELIKPLAENAIKTALKMKRPK
jgi:lysophospholipase L1-like esterase